MMKDRAESPILTVPNDLMYLPAIQAFVAEVAEKSGFGSSDTTMLLVALEEAVVNVVRHAFEAGEKATYQVIVERTVAGLKIIIKDQGLPYSPNLVPRFEVAADLESTPESGLGSHLMTRAVDEISFHNLGREGKELHLVKHLPYRSIEDINGPSELELFPEPVSTAGKPEKKDFSIRLIRPPEAYDVSKLFYRAYGYSYGIDTIYYPEKLAERHADGTIISVVTANSDDRVVGHAALVRDNVEDKTAEAAMAVVEPAFRGHGCQKLMISRLVDEARAVGLAGIFSKAVTNHVYAQKAGQKAGFRRCAVVAGLIPSDRTFKGIQSKLSQRESVVYGYRVVDDPGGIVLFPPPRHRGMIEKIYAGIGVERILREAPSNASSSVAQTGEDVSVIIPPGYNRAVIQVARNNEHIVDEVHAILKQLCYQKIEQMTLYISLHDPLTATHCGAFEEMGFFFAGILPFSHVGDALLLQYLNNVPMDYGKINIADEMGKEILAYAEACDPNKK
jgi:serine/threonine-protein kinase RsbW